MNAFWQKKKPKDLTRQEWESLCDGCGLCCLHKIQDEDTDEVFYTCVCCRLLDTETFRCTNYSQRSEIIPNCAVLTPEKASEFHWLPYTCAYRCLSEGRDLPEWHPLLTGDPLSAHQTEISMFGKVVREQDVDPDDIDAFVMEDAEIF